MALKKTNETFTHDPALRMQLQHEANKEQLDALLKVYGTIHPAPAKYLLNGLKNFVKKIMGKK